LVGWSSVWNDRHRRQKSKTNGSSTREHVCGLDWVLVVWECVKACRLAEITGVTGQVMMDWTDEVDEVFIGSDAADIGDCLRARLDSMVSPQSGTLIG
jgi:hypothetical protein